MGRDTSRPAPLSERPTEPFGNAEQAWFWFCQCHVARREGAVFDSSGAAFARPCDPDDIHVAVSGLRRRRVLGPWHLDVLERYGLRMAPPDSRRPDQARDWARWSEALDRLASVLKGKGIVAS
ncbi:MAG: hypothetical protein HQL34_01720 [Alphaproteobacteria bacterium]|nr:hypothetical protein [Alphaproteobacteria bacterium]